MQKYNKLSALAVWFLTLSDNLNINNIVHIQLKRNSQRRAFRGALTSAYTTCARHYYPKWASYFLDEVFRAHGADRLLVCYLKGAAHPKPADLANLWADQMLWLSEETRQRHIAELVPVASRFLRCLEAELRARPEFQPNFDRYVTRSNQHGPQD